MLAALNIKSFSKISFQKQKKLRLTHLELIKTRQHLLQVAVEIYIHRSTDLTVHVSQNGSKQPFFEHAVHLKSFQQEMFKDWGSDILLP